MKKLYLILFCSFLVIQLQGQQKNKKLNFNKSNKEKDIFLKKQWWIGLKGGVNMSKPVVDKQYSVISPTNYPLSNASKKYESFKGLGSNTTLEITFYFRGVSLSFQPTYRHSRFEYSNEFQWISNSEVNHRFVMNYEQEHKLDYLDFPFLLKYEIGIDRIRPYLQAGWYGARLLNADKTVEVTKTDFASGGSHEVKDEPIIIGATDLFAKYHWGLIAGAGLNYNLGNVRLNLDVQYKYTMSNISSTQNRHGSDRLSGVGDSLDDLKLNSIGISIGCLFPLRFLESGFKSLDKR